MNQLSSTTGYLRLRDVLRLFPVSKSTWWAGIKSGKFPSGHKLSARCVAWLERDILALIAQKAAA
ncbi:MAG: AlpA family phage regulatory protein [Ramlibacter sp.]|nr:AlpA family phage regulatory protein [Ramlibacter sp.]